MIMGSKLSEGEDLITDINVTPFVDVVLVLLVIFMVTASLLVRKGIDVELPQASNAQPLNSKGKVEEVVISLTQNGETFVDGKQLDVKGIKSFLKEVKLSPSDKLLVLQAHSKVAFEEAVKLIDLLKSINLNNYVIEVNPESSNSP